MEYQEAMKCLENELYCSVADASECAKYDCCKGCEHRQPKGFSYTDMYRTILDKSKEKETGEWLPDDDWWDGDTWFCSNCNEAFVLMNGNPKENNLKYCPFCGAEMSFKNIIDTVKED